MSEKREAPRDAGPVRQEAAPGPRHRAYYPVLRPRPTELVIGTILSTRPLGVLTHYHEGRTKGCLGKGRCPYCELPDCPPKWEGYLWLLLPNGAVAIACISAEAYRNCPELSDGQSDLRGRGLTLRRIGQANNSQVRASLGQQSLQPARCKCPLDLYGYLVDLWMREKTPERDR